MLLSWLGCPFPEASDDSLGEIKPAGLPKKMRDMKEEGRQMAGNCPGEDSLGQREASPFALSLSM